MIAIAASVHKTVTQIINLSVHMVRGYYVIMLDDVQNAVGQLKVGEYIMVTRFTVWFEQNVSLRTLLLH